MPKDLNLDCRVAKSNFNSTNVYFLEMLKTLFKEIRESSMFYQHIHQKQNFTTLYKGSEIISHNPPTLNIK